MDGMMAAPELPPTPKHFTRRIAERRYIRRDAAGEVPIVIELGEPIRDVVCVEGTDWRCPVRITVGADEIIRSAFGVDAVQSLLLAFAMARIELRSIANRPGTEVLWEGERIDPSGEFRQSDMC